jgi:hypothetical protein
MFARRTSVTATHSSAASAAAAAPSPPPPMSRDPAAAAAATATAASTSLFPGAPLSAAADMRDYEWEGSSSTAPILAYMTVMLRVGAVGWSAEDVELSKRLAALDVTDFGKDVASNNSNVHAAATTTK